MYCTRYSWKLFSSVATNGTQVTEIKDPWWMIVLYMHHSRSSKNLNACSENVFMRTGTSLAHLCCCLWPFWLFLHRRQGCHAWPGSRVGCRLLSFSWTPWYPSLARCDCWQPPLWWALLAQMAYYFFLAHCLSSLLQLFGSVASCSGGTDHFPEWQNTQRTGVETHIIFKSINWVCNCDTAMLSFDN